MDKLPSVSYIRMVDIWLITVQLIPFLYVVLRTLIELLEEDIMAINHHGRAIDVSNTNNLVRGMTSEHNKKLKIGLNLFGKLPVILF